MVRNPFTDQALVRGSLYTSVSRLARRTQALHAAKIHGSDASLTIAKLAATYAGHAATAVDLGCGRGSVAHNLTKQLRLRGLFVLDQSLALLRAASERLAEVPTTTAGICGDFHQLPIASGGVDLVIAAFCLYHSNTPEVVIAEISRCLAATGRMIAATKSEDSYREIDELVEASGLDLRACKRPGLYTSFNSQNAARIMSTKLQVAHQCHERHVFSFKDFDHLAAYLATSPKYQLPRELSEPTRLARELRIRVPERALTAASTVTYVIAAKS